MDKKDIKFMSRFLLGLCIVGGIIAVSVIGLIAYFVFKFTVIGGHFVKEYIPLKTPDDMQEGLMFSFSKGRQLDVFGDMVGIKRRKIKFIKEPDFLYKIRLRNFGIKKKADEQHITSDKK